MAAREALREQATRDSLTGLWNRRSITEALEREAARAKREGSSLALLMADLDRFKQVNDTYGHVAGDVVLREASRRMASSARVYDFVGRYGGEEFLILLPGCGEVVATRYAERIRAAIAEAPVTIDGDVQLPITASFGVTASSGTNCGSPQALIQAADEALYAAKRGGRNKVVFVAVAVPQPQ
jgi:diguanylate cyclase (GGDEF)-like protein